MKIAIKTLGCKSNRYESDRLFEELGKEHTVFELNEGVNTFQKRTECSADLLVVNTCTVTHVADRKSRQAIRSFKKLNPECKVIVFGCGVNVAPKQYEEMSEVDLMAKDTDQVLEFAQEFAEKQQDFERCEYESQSELGMRTRALVKIQDGCDSYCSYCIIPMARGPEFSFPSAEILAEVKRKEDEGYKEIVLTGINIGEWSEGDMNLADLFEMLINETTSVRFRVSSIEPKNFSEKFFQLFATGRLCPHMHMSLQSGCDSVLKRMRRKYMTDTFEDVCMRLREVVPDIGLTTDVIVGFPGETDEEFKETYDFVERLGFLGLHVFPYSKREGTVAAYMKNHISPEVKKERCRMLRELSQEMSKRFKKGSLGKEYEVVAEHFASSERDGGMKVFRGFTANYIPVEFAGEENLMGKAVKIKLNHLRENGSVQSSIC